MSGLRIDAYLSNVEGVVIDFVTRYDWMTEPDEARIRTIGKNDGQAWNVDHRIRELDLVQKGPGRFELGVTHPYAPWELKMERYGHVLQRFMSHDWTHQGFSNAATFLAWLYLSQEEGLVDRLRAMRRVDGTVNENKVAKLFYTARLTIDPWAYEIPFHVPAEFSGWVSRFKPCVDWREVADQFSEEPSNARSMD